MWQKGRALSEVCLEGEMEEKEKRWRDRMCVVNYFYRMGEEMGMSVKRTQG